MKRLEVLSPAAGIAALEWMRDNEWTSLLDVLVPTNAYTGRQYAEWVTATEVVQGDAAPYPVRGRCSNGAEGQWALSEIFGVRWDRRNQYDGLAGPGGVPDFSGPHWLLSDRELKAAVLEGSGRALAEWQRRGQEVPTVDHDPVWLS